MQTYVLQGQAKPVRFSGILLAEESTETSSSLRWLELSLYRIAEGPRTGHYVLHRTGQSVVFHRPKTCGYGQATSWEHVPDDAEPCPVCQPVEPFAQGIHGRGSDPGYEVWLESPRHKVVTCVTPVHVEKALLMRRKDGTTFLSTPASSLIAKACEKDQRLKDYFSEAEQL